MQQSIVLYLLVADSMEQFICPALNVMTVKQISGPMSLVCQFDDVIVVRHLFVDESQSSVVMMEQRYSIQ